MVRRVTIFWTSYTPTKWRFLGPCGSFGFSEATKQCDPSFLSWFTHTEYVSLGGVAKQEYLQSYSVQRRVGGRGYGVFEEAAHGDWITERTPSGDKYQDDLQGRAF